MTNSSHIRAVSAWEGPILRAAIWDSFKKLDPRLMFKNPVMFVVEVGSVLTTLIWLRDLMAPPAGGTGFQDGDGAVPLYPESITVAHSGGGLDRTGTGPRAASPTASATTPRPARCVGAGDGRGGAGDVHRRGAQRGGVSL